jgi:hypothetical protein
MKKTICIMVAVVLILAAVSCLAQEQKTWRAGVAWTRLTDSTTREMLGDDWAVGIERSLGDTFNMANLQGDLSVAAFYKPFKKHGIEFRDIFVGLRWRFGPGAKPDCDGFYGGALAGAAFLNADNGFEDMNKTNFEWGVLAGMNFAKTWYAEVGYNDPGGFWGADTANMSVTVGYRF